MDRETACNILTRVRAERTKTAAGTLETAIHQMNNQQVKTDALHDVGNMALLTTGVGALGSGLVGLYNLLSRRRRKPSTRSGPIDLPLPYPAEQKFAGFLDGISGFMGGNQATTKGGIPAYGPAMLFAGMGGLGAGWKGMDMALDARRKSERERELTQARQEFHDALLSQYDRPLESVHNSSRHKLKAAGDTSEMMKVGAALDALYDRFEKSGITASDVGGAALGGYGMYAGLTGLLAGALMYDKTRKRSQSAIVQKALQRRERQRALAQPPEIYARPEPIPHLSPTQESAP